MTRVDRDKTRKLNTLILEGLSEIKGNIDFEKKLYDKMERLNIFNGELRKIMLTHDMDEVELSVKYMLLNSIYDVLGSEKYGFEPFYKNKIKLTFLHRYPNNTQIPYARIFEKSKRYEEKYKKDLSEFTLSEIENVLNELKPLTESASHVNGRIITAYIDWCCSNELTSVKNNELKNKSVDYFKGFVDTELQLYFSDEVINKLSKDCNNPQDAVLLKMLFEGVQGISLSEIRNIKKIHVKEAIENNNTITVYDDDNGKRKIKLEPSTIKLLKRAMEQNEYQKRNGKLDDESIGLITNLVDNDYVIRTSITKTDFGNRPVDKMVIYRRIKTISEVLGYPHLTTKNIVRSGIIYEASKKMKNGELEKEDYLEICAKYNIENWYPVKKYCNPQIINKIYNNVPIMT
jgi:hypothetical protein